MRDYVYHLIQDPPDRVFWPVVIAVQIKVIILLAMYSSL